MIAKLEKERIIMAMRVIAHRGWSGKYPENTMLAFKNAVDLGCDGIELDVHLSKDGEVMIIHDEKLARTSGYDGVVSDYTRAELEKISAGKTKDDKFGFTPIPSLEEYLDYVSKYPIVTNIELKTAPTYYPGIEEKTLELVEKFGCQDRVFFSSFNWLSLMKMKMLNPSYRCGTLIEVPRVENIACQLADIGFECYHPDFKLIDEGVVAQCHLHDVEINVWTVNEEDDIKKCLKWGVDGLITNNPDLAKSLLS